MFGTVLPVKGEMKVRDFEAYRAVYCGLCKELGRRYGLASRFLLNYDLVLVAALADALSGEAGEIRCEGCFANPLAKRATLYGTAGLALAADALVLLSWYKLRDNLADEGLGKRFAYRLAQPFARRMRKKAAALRPGLDALLAREMERQQALEAAGCARPDEACEPTAKMCEAIFALAAPGEAEVPILRRLGLFAGQVVYLADAADDYADDEKRGGYNVFLRMGMGREEALAAAKARCRMAAGETALCYNLLKPLIYKDILDNIFFLGLPQGIEKAGTGPRIKGDKHGQIERV